MRLFFVVLGVCLVGLAGCGGDDEQTSSAGGTSSSPSTSTSAGVTTSPGTRTTPSDTPSGGQSSSPSGGTSTNSGGSSTTSGGSTTTGLEGFKRVSGSEDDAAAAAVRGFFMALSFHDGDKACAFLAEGTKKQVVETLGSTPKLKGKGCGPVVRQLTNSYSLPYRQSFRKLKVSKVYAKGDAGLAWYSMRTEPLTVMPMRREHGQWHVGALGGVPADHVPIR